MEGIKQEIPTIKTEPPANDSNIMDEDEYEDDNDLIIPPQDSQGQAWLVKLPKDLWGAWKHIYDSADDTPIEIGRLRLWDKGGKEDPLKMKAKVILNTEIGQQKSLPTTYDLKIRASGYANTVVFSEKDLPNQARKQPKFEYGKPQGIQNKNDRYGKNAKPGSYRTVIPKQTALAPLIQNEATIQATEEATFASLAQKWKEHLQPKVTTEISHSVDRRHRINAANNFSAFSSFVKTSTPASKAAAQKKKAPKEKAVRMDHQDLLDALFQCFREYRYWPMRALRARLKQPEAYIKQALEQIAFMAKSGSFNLTWQLKPEFRAQVDQTGAKEEVIKAEEMGDVPEGSGDDTGAGSEEEDAGEFEDVKMEG